MEIKNPTAYLDCVRRVAEQYLEGNNPDGSRRMEDSGGGGPVGCAIPSGEGAMRGKAVVAFVVGNANESDGTKKKLLAIALTEMLLNSSSSVLKETVCKELLNRKLIQIPETEAVRKKEGRLDIVETFKRSLINSKTELFRMGEQHQKFFHDIWERYSGAINPASMSSALFAKAMSLLGLGVSRSAAAAEAGDQSDTSSAAKRTGPGNSG